MGNASNPYSKQHTVRTRDGGTVTLTVNRGAAIKLMCTECLGWDTHPRDCTAKLCPLYPFRGLTTASRNAGG